MLGSDKPPLCLFCCKTSAKHFGGRWRATAFLNSAAAAETALINILSISLHPQDQQPGGRTAITRAASDPLYVRQSFSLYDRSSAPNAFGWAVCMQGGTLWALFPSTLLFSRITQRGFFLFTLWTFASCTVTRGRHGAHGWFSRKWSQADLELKHSSRLACFLLLRAYGRGVKLTYKMGAKIKIFFKLRADFRI